VTAPSTRPQENPVIERKRGSGGFIVMALTLLLLVAQASAPSPLYPVYQNQWDLSPVGVTSVFAVYVVGLLITLIVVGSLSDHIGRRPVVIGSTIVAIGGLVVFATADGIGDLLVARALQGASVGAATGALGAALIDRQPAGHPKLAAVLNGAIPPAALTIGAISSGLLVEFAPEPTITVFVLFAALILAAGIAVAFLAEPHARRAGALRSLRPTISMPREVRRVFGAVVGCMAASWALAGLYLGLGPSIVASVLHIDSHFAAALGVATLTGFGALTGLAIQRADARTSMLVGAAALVAGPLLTVVALEADSTWGFFASTALAGVGFGAAFQSALRLVLAVVPAAGRAGVLSTVYLVSYLAFGLPSIVAGILVPSVGLLNVAAGYAMVVAAVAAFALVLQLVLQRDKVAELLPDAIDAAR
jgi:predicted MFS family arabinose efflux permease